MFIASSNTSTKTGQPLYHEVVLDSVLSNPGPNLHFEIVLSDFIFMYLTNTVNVNDHDAKELICYYCAIVYMLFCYSLK